MKLKRHNVKSPDPFVGPSTVSRLVPFREPSPAERRRRVYRLAYTRDEFEEAVREFIVEGRPEKMMKIQERIEATKDR